MRRAIPPITERGDELKQRLEQEHDGRKKPRLQMRSLLASGHARTRQQGASLLGVSPNTVGHWLASYQTGGLSTVLTIYIAPGKSVSLAPDVLAGIEQALQQPAGFASYEDVRQWVEHTYPVRIKSQNAVYHCAYQIQGQTQTTTSKSHKKRLMRRSSFRHPMLTNYVQYVAPPTSVLSRCLRKMRVALAG
jgi:hypothetical protein